MTLVTGFEGLAYPQIQVPPYRFTQRVNEVKDYVTDWVSLSVPGSVWVVPVGDTISGSVWSADAGLVLADEAFTDSSTTVWVSGGLAGYLYRVSNVVTTAAGRVAERKFYFRITAA